MPTRQIYHLSLWCFKQATKLSLHFSENFSQWTMQNPKGIGISLSLINFVMGHLYAKCRRELHKKQVGLALNKLSALTAESFSLLLGFIILWKIINFKVFEVPNFQQATVLWKVLYKNLVSISNSKFISLEIYRYEKFARGLKFHIPPVEE